MIRIDYLQSPKSLSELFAFKIDPGHQVEQIVVSANNEISFGRNCEVNYKLIFWVTREGEDAA
jgi:hypothetical protein